MLIYFHTCVAEAADLRHSLAALDQRCGGMRRAHRHLAARRTTQKSTTTPSGAEDADQESTPTPSGAEDDAEDQESTLTPSGAEDTEAQESTPTPSGAEDDAEEHIDA